MKNIISTFLTVLLIISVVACGNNTVSNDNNSIEKKKFVVGFDAEYPPYGYLNDNGEYTGFDLELAAEVCKRLGYELVKQPIDWDSKDMELNSGSIDCIWNGFTVTGRENNYTWSIPYVDNSIVVVVNNESNIKELADLSGKTVIVQAGSSGLSALEDESIPENIDLRNSFKDLLQCQDYNSAFMNLESGLVDAIVVDIGVAKFQLNNRKDLFRMLDTEISKEQYAIGFKKGNTELKDIVEKTVIEMYKDGSFMNIAKKYESFSLPNMICIGEYIK